MRRRRLGTLTAALCLGGALTACGGGNDGEGYAAVGARGGGSPGGAVAPSGSVRLVPLDGPSASGTTSSTSSPRPDGAPAGPDTGARTETGTGTGGGTPTGSATVTLPGAGGAGPTTPGATAPPLPAPGTPGGPGGPSSTPPAPRPSGTATPAPAPSPARLTLSVPVLAEGDRRWCQEVTLTFRNTGGTAVASGTVAFETHVIGALGIDWATVESAQPLPAPIAAGAAKKHTYTVCVESWRVPLGMRIETQRVTAAWK
ncbi:hypothetical protein [Streptomyces tritici]|uniref:hypothetical protein n=1 Tax=Streptomyces tritici TaxID=2054410 RepID=UPI003AF0F93F